MEDLLLVPVPIFDKSRNVIAYYTSFRIGNALLEEGKTFSGVTDLPFFDFMNKIGLEALTYDKMIFVPVTDIQLAMPLEKECQVDHSLVVLTLDKNNALATPNLHRMWHYKEQGFKIAFYSFGDIAELETFLPFVDYLFCDRNNDRLMPVMRFIKAHGPHVNVIATNVETAKEFDTASFYGVELMQGQFYKYPAHLRHEHVSPLQLNYLQLLDHVNRDDFDFNVFSKIVMRDTALTLQFLRVVNSTFGQGNKINSLRHAAAMLGQNEIRRWISTAVTNMLSRDKPGELTRISLLRAKFCENMAGRFEMGVHAENLFLTGLLSVLDAILDMTMERALEMIIVPEKVKDALLGEEGEYTEVLRFVILYEQGNWLEVSRTALMKNIQIAEIRSAYVDALLWYGRMVNMTIDEDDLETE